MADLIRNEDINAGPCSNCGSSWKRCLQGWADTGDGGRHPAGVCCPECHETDTHQADAARRREAVRREELRGERAAAKELIDSCTDQGRGIDGRSYWKLVDAIAPLLGGKGKGTAELPSGDALDRAIALTVGASSRNTLIEEIAKLIDRADAAALQAAQLRETAADARRTRERSGAAVRRATALELELREARLGKSEAEAEAANLRNRIRELEARTDLGRFSNRALAAEIQRRLGS